MAPRKKKATKKATKKASPKRKAATTKKQKSSQLEVMTAARDFFATSKKYDGQVILMDELDNTVPGYTSTQSLALDWVIGNAGLPQSRIFDVSGDEGTGKSTIGDHVMAEVQRLGGHAWLWDTENARDNRYQQKIGVSRKKAAQILCHTMEDGFELMRDVLLWHLQHDPDRPGIILWDTPAGVPTRAEADPEKKGERFGPAKIIREHLRKLNQVLQQTRWMLGVVNQTYLGQMAGGQTYKAVYGGGGIPFYSSVRLSLSKREKFWRKSSDKALGLPPMGQTILIKCLKNRVSVPFRSRRVCIHYGEGYSNTWEVFNTLLGAGCIALKGSWYSIDAAGWPELAELCPKSWQSGHMGLNDLIAEIPDLWNAMIDEYQQVMRASYGST